MEGQVQAPLLEASPPIQQTAPSMEAVQTTQYSEGGALNSITAGKMNMKDIVISALLIALSLYGMFYYRKAIKALDEQPTKEEYETISEDVDELKYNVKKALGKKYETT